MKTYGCEYVFALRASTVNTMRYPDSEGRLALDGGAIAANYHPGGVIPGLQETLGWVVADENQVTNYGGDDVSEQRKGRRNGNGNGHFNRQLASAADLEQLLVGGDIGKRRHDEASESGPARIEPGELQQAVELHVCMGLNACQGHGRDGTGEIAGTGECATVLHVCHGANECRGQGGCGYSGSDAEQAKPGDQACRWNGSCASPINQSRVHAAGPYRGTSVWKRARMIFEHRMYEAGVPFGPAPGEGFPDDLVPAYEAKRGQPQPRRSASSGS